MERLRATVRRVRAEGFTPKEFRAICVFSLASLSAIVVTGAAVRLTGSGLGCEDWPNCNDQRFVDVSSGHAAIEQVNRLFTFLVALAVVLAALAAWFRRPRRRDMLVLSALIVLGIPGQALVGAAVVRTDLNPVVVQLHFVLSMVLIALAVVMLIRADEPDDGKRVRAVLPRTEGRVRLLTVWTALAVLAGTMVTGHGPHSGDEEAKRLTWMSVRWATRVHSAVVWIAVANALALLWHLRGRTRDRETLAAPLGAWVGVAALQGTVGYWQYFAGVPAGLVAAHVAGATALWGVTVWLWCATRRVTQSAREMVDDHVDDIIARRRRRAVSPSRSTT
jgi:heme a synthase